MEGQSADTERLEYLLALRARVEWDWSDGPGRDVALAATDAALRNVEPEAQVATLEVQ
jgi:hypothetical protein